MFRSKLQHVSVSCTHLLALTAEGLVFSWGEGRKGQLGHGQLGDFAFSLKKILFFFSSLKSLKKTFLIFHGSIVT
jgi:alpha-tubulin suppressor-like RCC1 family protein